MSCPSIKYEYQNWKIKWVKIHHLDTDYVFDRKQLTDAILFYIEENLQWSGDDDDDDHLACDHATWLCFKN
jgi:hypothetical protein